MALLYVNCLPIKRNQNSQCHKVSEFSMSLYLVHRFHKLHIRLVRIDCMSCTVQLITSLDNWHTCKIFFHRISIGTHHNMYMYSINHLNIIIE